MQSLFPLPKNDQKWSKITPQKDILVRFCRIVPLDVAKICMEVVTNGDVKFSKDYITEEILVYKLQVKVLFSNQIRILGIGQYLLQFCHEGSNQGYVEFETIIFGSM